MLKVEFHSHTNHNHPNETDYGAKELIDHAILLGYDALCITEHFSPMHALPDFRKNPFDSYNAVKDYAKERGLLLIPSVEYYFPEGDVLLINVTQKDLAGILSFDDLRGLPQSVLKIAPHPFYNMSYCLNENLIKHKDIFDAVEYSFFYNRFYNSPNIKAKTFADMHGLPLIGDSDLHSLKWMGYNYTNVNSAKNARSIVDAVRKKEISIVTRPLPLNLFFYAFYFHSIRAPRKVLFKIKQKITSRI